MVHQIIDFCGCFSQSLFALKVFPKWLTPLPCDLSIFHIWFFKIVYLYGRVRSLLLAAHESFRFGCTLQLWPMGSRAHRLSSWYVGLVDLSTDPISMWNLSYWTGNWTHGPCIAGQILNCWTTSEIFALDSLWGTFSGKLIYGSDHP